LSYGFRRAGDGEGGRFAEKQVVAKIAGRMARRNDVSTESSGRRVARRAGAGR